MPAPPASIPGRSDRKPSCRSADCVLVEIVQMSHAGT
jgi:hypothetical protein